MGTRHYIAQARLRRPTVPPAVSAYIVDSYVRLRKISKDTAEQKKLYIYTSARTLLGVLRLSQALARLRFADMVQHDDVDEALRLMECSKESLLDDEDREQEPDRSVVSQIFRLVKQMAAEGGGRRQRKRQRRFGKGPGGERDMEVDSDENGDNELSLIDIRSRVLGAGYTEAQLNETIIEVRLLFILLKVFANDACSTKTWTSGRGWQTGSSSGLSIPSVLLYILMYAMRMDVNGR